MKAYVAKSSRHQLLLVDQLCYVRIWSSRPICQLSQCSNEPLQYHNSVEFECIGVRSSIHTTNTSTSRCFHRHSLSTASMHLLHFRSMLESSCSGKMMVLGTSRPICPMKWKPTLLSSSFQPGTGPIFCSKACSGVHLGSLISSWTRERDETTYKEKGGGERHIVVN